MRFWCRSDLKKCWTISHSRFNTFESIANASFFHSFIWIHLTEREKDFYICMNYCLLSHFWHTAATDKPVIITYVCAKTFSTDFPSSQKFGQITYIQMKSQSNHHIFGYHFYIAYHSLLIIFTLFHPFGKSFGCHGKHTVNWSVFYYMKTFCQMITTFYQRKSMFFS